MKQQANAPIIIAAVAVLVLVLGFIAWKTFSAQAQVADIQTIKAHQSKKMQD